MNKKNLFRLFITIICIFVMRNSVAQSPLNLDATGANNYLNEYCYNVLSWKYNADCEKGGIGWGYSYYITINAASDDALAGGSSATDRLEFIAADCYNLTPDNNGPAALWHKYLTGIDYCNYLLYFIDESIEEADRYIAEAKFLRAYYYFHFTRLFGDVPLMGIRSLTSLETYK